MGREKLKPCKATGHPEKRHPKLSVLLTCMLDGLGLRLPCRRLMESGSSCRESLNAAPLWVCPVPPSAAMVIYDTSRKHVGASREANVKGQRLQPNCDTWRGRGTDLCWRQRASRKQLPDNDHKAFPFSSVHRAGPCYIAPATTHASIKGNFAGAHEPRSRLLI